MKTEPSKGSFHHPASRQDQKALRARWPLDDLQFEPIALAQISDPLGDPAIVDAVGPNLSQLAETMCQGSQDGPRPIAILDARRVHHHQQEQSQRVDQQMAFAPVDQLAGIKAALAPTTIRGLDALAVEDRGGGLSLPPFLFSDQVAQAVVNPLPDAIQAPRAEVAVDGLPRRILVRQVAPLAAGPADVKDGIDRQAHIGSAVTTAGFGRRDQSFDILPFSVGQVARVELIAHTHMLPEPTETF